MLGSLFATPSHAEVLEKLRKSAAMFKDFEAFLRTQLDDEGEIEENLTAAAYTDEDTAAVQDGIRRHKLSPEKLVQFLQIDNEEHIAPCVILIGIDGGVDAETAIDSFAELMETYGFDVFEHAPPESSVERLTDEMEAGIDDMLDTTLEQMADVAREVEKAIPEIVEAVQAGLKTGNEVVVVPKGGNANTERFGLGNGNTND